MYIYIYACLLCFQHLGCHIHFISSNSLVAQMTFYSSKTGLLQKIQKRGSTAVQPSWYWLVSTGQQIRTQDVQVLQHSAHPEAPNHSKGKNLLSDTLLTLTRERILSFGGFGALRVRRFKTDGFVSLCG